MKNGAYGDIFKCLVYWTKSPKICNFKLYKTKKSRESSNFRSLTVDRFIDKSHSWLNVFEILLIPIKSRGESSYQRTVIIFPLFYASISFSYLADLPLVWVSPAKARVCRVQIDSRLWTSYLISLQVPCSPFIPPPSLHDFGPLIPTSAFNLFSPKWLTAALIMPHMCRQTTRIQPNGHLSHVNVSSLVRSHLCLMCRYFEEYSGLIDLSPTLATHSYVSVDAQQFTMKPWHIYNSNFSVIFWSFVFCFWYNILQPPFLS